MRNEYSVLLLQEGRFNSVTNQLTIYVRERHAKNELLGILVQDNRQPGKPVTMMAERGVMIGSGSEPRIVMFNGNRQELDRATGRIRFLTFERWSFSIDWLSNSPGTRWRQPNERFIGELLDPGDSPGERHYRNKFIAEGHNRLLVPLYSLVFALIGLVCLLVGEFDRRGQAKRILLTVGIVIPIQAAAIGLFNLAGKVPAVLPLMYLNVLVPAVACIWILTRSQRMRVRHFVAEAPAGSAR
jgi:lipopolysaccharide export system permease protein